MHVAILGLGPRGLSVLERLVIRLRDDPPDSEVVIWAVDPVEHGSGRVWRSTQPWWLTMNATAGEVTVRSPDGFVSEPRLGAAGEYPTRGAYGEYLTNVFDELRGSAPPGVAVRPVLTSATSVDRAEDGRLVVGLDTGRRLAVDKVVLATGHGTDDGNAGRVDGCPYIGAGIAADMPLDAVRPGMTVALRGLGLTFYDLVRAFSLGRGGRFVRSSSGVLRYRPGGGEPFVVAGSRRGLPFLARPRAAGVRETAPRPVFLTPDRLEALRARAGATRGTPQLDFAGEIEPLIQAEVELAYYRCWARLRGGDAASDRFATDFELHVGDGDGRELLAHHGLDGVPPLDLHALGRPFDGASFTSAGEFDRRLVELLRADVVESRRGVTASPVKAALEVLRQLRPLLPCVVDFGGLLPASHRDFLGRWEPLSYVLSAGPPDDHVEQLVALIEAGFVRIAGPSASFDADARSGRWVVASPAVAGSERTADVLIDARVPPTDITRTTSPLIRQLLHAGMVSEYVSGDPTTGARFPTGGLAVTRAPFHVVDADGTPDPDIYAIGVAVDRTRWFTQVGTGRPGRDSPFCRDADDIAVDIVEWRGRTPAQSVVLMGQHTSVRRSSGSVAEATT